MRGRWRTRQRRALAHAWREAGTFAVRAATIASEGAASGMLPAAVSRWDCCWWKGPPRGSRVDVVVVVAVADMAERKVGLAGLLLLLLLLLRL